MRTLIFSLVLFSSFAVAADFTAPRLTGPVVDEVGVLGARESVELSALLRSLQSKGKAQFTVLITRSLQDYSIEEYGIKLADTWKLGTERGDNGLILIVAPKERKMRFEVGRGLEGELPDVVSKRILDDVIRPYFKNGDVESGIVAGVIQVSRILGMTEEEIRQTVSQSYSNPPAQQRSSGSKSPGNLIVFGLFFLIGFLGPVLLGVICGGIGYALFSIPGGIFGFILGFFIGIIFRGGFRRTGISSGRSVWWGGGSGGGGSFGGFSGGGGGWSGGGGSFGGGGSSSSW